MKARGERPIPAEQMLRDLRINRIFEGSTEIMHLFIAREAVDAHLSVAGDIIDPEAAFGRKARAAAKAGGFYAKWLPTLAVGRGQLPSGFNEFGPLAGHLRYVERAARKMARETFYGMSRWQGAMERRQAYLGRIVDIGAELFAMAAACSRAAMITKQDPKQGAAAYELADVFCRQARLRVETLFDGLWSNTDADDRVVARKLLDGDYTWLEAGVLDQSEGTGPWISEWSAGASDKPNVHRAYR